MLTENIAQFIAQTTYEKLPQQAIDNAKRSILDCLGCALAACEEPASQIVSQHVKEMGGVEQAGVISAGFKAPAQMAAWANGTLAHALDYDDYTLTSWIGHPTVAVLPAVLSLAEKLHLSGKEVLTAYLIGFEVGAKIGLVCGKRHYELGWHNTSTLGSLASAAASAKLIGLSGEETRAALGIAASLAGGLRQNFGTMTKPLHAGNAARNGVVAALLAEKGLTADRNVLESPLGFCKTLGGGADFDTDMENVGRSLGSPFDIVSPGVCLKPYPSCGYSHWAIDAALYLKEIHQLNPADIAEIELRCHPLIPKVCIHSRPRSSLEGKFSVEFCVAVALIDGKVSLKQFINERVSDVVVQELISMTRYVHPPDFEVTSWAGEVAIELKGGLIYSRRVETAKGSPQNPLSRDEVCHKYRDCACLALSQKSVERSLDLVLNLELLQDISELMNILTLG